jgi:hypothetical protein
VSGGGVCIGFIRVLLLRVPQAMHLLGKREEYGHGEPAKRSLYYGSRGGWCRQISDSTGHRSLLAGGEENDQRVLVTESRRRRAERECLSIEGMRGVNNRDVRHHSIRDWGILPSLAMRS